VLVQRFNYPHKNISVSFFGLFDAFTVTVPNSSSLGSLINSYSCSERRFPHCSQV
jgi:hypothetical protein